MKGNFGRVMEQKFLFNNAKREITLQHFGAEIRCMTECGECVSRLYCITTALIYVPNGMAMAMAQHVPNGTISLEPESVRGSVAKSQTVGRKTERQAGWQAHCKMQNQSEQEAALGMEQGQSTLWGCSKKKLKINKKYVKLLNGNKPILQVSKHYLNTILIIG